MIKLFGTDGMRGVWNEPPFTADVLFQVAFHAGRLSLERKARDTAYRACGDQFLIARDTRASGPEIAKILSQGLNASGVEVLDLGVLPTPAVAYLVPKRKALGGAVISASHNPAEFNGVKLFSAFGKKLPDSWESEIERAAGSSPTPSSTDLSKSHKDSGGLDEYLTFLKQTFSPVKDLSGLKIVLDCAHGAGHAVAPRLLRELGADVVLLGAAPDGDNINQGFGALYPQAMQEAVRREGAACGFALDGDGDRVIFTDEKGQDASGDHILASCAAHLLNQGRLKNKKLVVTVMSSFGLIRAMEKLKISVIQTPVGDRYVAEAMEKSGANLGGEQAGHIIFGDYVQTGDGLVTALQVLKMLCETGRPLGELFRIVEKCPQILLNVPVKNKVPIEQVAGLADTIAQVEKKLGSDGRLLVRYSGTEPLLRIMLEGSSESRITALANEIAQAAEKELGAVRK